MDAAATRAAQPRRRPAAAAPGARYAPVAMLLLASLSWGLSATLTKPALTQLTATDLFGVEIGVGVVPLLWLGRSRSRRRGVARRRLGRADLLLVALGLLEPGLTYLLFDLGVMRTTASHAALLLALDAPATLVLAAVFLRERVDAALLGSLALGVLGSLLITWRSDGTRSGAVGDLLVVGSALTAAGYGVLARHVAAARDPVTVTTVQMVAALALAVPVLAASAARGHSRLTNADAGHLTLAVAVGLLGGVVPFLLFNKAITRVSASRASLLLVLVPVMGAAFAVLLLGDRITPTASTGGALAVLAAAIAAGRPDDDRVPDAGSTRQAGTHSS